MKSPEFWYPSDAPSFLVRAPRVLLAPLALLYAFGGRTRQRMTPPERVSVPVVCVGNFTAGGAGKTPVSIALFEQLREIGETPHFLSRGYGGRETGPTRVNTQKHRAADVGDEPLLLGRHGPAWVSADRVAGAFAAEQDGASVIVLDDGFQNPRLHKDMSLIVVDTEVGIGNGAVIPAGPLREPLDRAIERTSIIVALSRDGATRDIPSDLSTLALKHQVTVIKASLGAEPSIAARVKDRSFIAYAGIGRPEKFFATLRALGAKLIHAEAFPDHYMYGEQDAARLLHLAENETAALITTEKDASRLASLTGTAGTALFEASETLPVTAKFRDRDTLKVLLKKHLDAARASHTYAPPGTRSA